jgi:DNA mismatch endonuclease, patch repair protein
MRPEVANEQWTNKNMSTTWVTTAQTTRRMSLQARRDTTPERVVRRKLHAAGCRFRVSYAIPDLRRCSIDIAFPRQRVAVFIDGCFWHGCAEHGTRPKSNADRWATKLVENSARDRRVDQFLEQRGWVVLRVWEHEDAGIACSRILEVLASRANSA